MKELRKALSLTLSLAMLVSSTSCSAKFGESVTDKTEKLCDAILDRDYKKIEKMASKGDKKLEGLLPLSTDGLEEDNEAREIIASTLQFEIDEDSFEGDFLGREGSIDVTFTYVDYEKAVEDITIFEEIDAFEAAIEDCDDTVEQTITFEFEKDGSDIVCTNIGDIADLFPYSSEEFNFALSRDSYTGTVEFLNLNDGNGYIDVYTITCNLPIEGDGQSLTWNYYWTVECYDVNLYTSDVMESDTDTFLTAFYSEDDIIPDGNYVFTYYTEDGLILGTGSVEVTHTEVVPEPTPSPSGDSGDVGPYFVAPYDGVIALPDTGLVLDLPSTYFCLDSDSSSIQSVFGDNETLKENLVFFAVDIVTMGGAFCVRLPNLGSYDATAAQTAVNNAMSSFAPDGVTINDTYSQDFVVGDYTYTVTTMEVTQDGTTTSYCNFVIVGDEGACYLIYFFSDGTNNVEEFMGGLSMS